MPKYGKRYRAAFEVASQAGTVKDLAAAVKLVKETARAKFDETIVIVDIAGRGGTDGEPVPRVRAEEKAEKFQQVVGTRVVWHHL